MDLQIWLSPNIGTSTAVLDLAFFCPNRSGFGQGHILQANIRPTPRQAQLSDRITITRDDKVLFRDATLLRGDIASQLDRPGVGNGARAMAFVLYAAPDAEAYLDRIRDLLPNTAGASLVAEGALVMRFLAADGFGLRQSLLPVLDLLTGNDLPRSWRL